MRTTTRDSSLGGASSMSPHGDPRGLPWGTPTSPGKGQWADSLARVRIHIYAYPAASYGQPGAIIIYTNINL
jgi:hypothetical protein